MKKMSLFMCLFLMLLGSVGYSNVSEVKSEKSVNEPINRALKSGIELLDTIDVSYLDVSNIKFVLNVELGSGDGEYFVGDTVCIFADLIDSGKAIYTKSEIINFDQWTGDIGVVDDINSSETFLIMPAYDLNITAIYISFPAFEVYKLIVKNGYSEMFPNEEYYEYGDSVAIYGKAPVNDCKVGHRFPLDCEDYRSYVFDKWTGDINYVTDIYSENISLIMPAKNISLTAVYKICHCIMPVYLSVNNGSGSGAYSQGGMVSISADASPEGYKFLEWTGDVANVADKYASNTIITMSEKNISVSAVYDLNCPCAFSLSVNNGVGSNIYNWGDRIKISANPPQQGCVFEKWIGDIFIIEDSITNPNVYVSLYSDANITATYICDTITGIQEIGLSSQFKCYPNPFNDQANIRFTLGSASNVNVALFNLMGEQVALLTNRNYLVGNHELILNRDNLSSGIYLLQLKTKFDNKIIKLNIR